MAEDDDHPDCLDTGKGFLPRSARQYLENPDEYEGDVSDVQHDIRKRCEIAREQLRYLENNRELWELREAAAMLQDLDPDALEGIEPGDSGADSQHMHQPLPDEQAVDFAIHRETLAALERIQAELSEFAVDWLVDAIDEDDVPDEYGSKAQFREYLQSHRQAFRTEVIDDRRSDADIFRGDDYVTVDDVIRMALRLAPSEDEIDQWKDREDVLSLVYGDSIETQLEVVRRFDRALDVSLLERK